MPRETERERTARKKIRRSIDVEQLESAVEDVLDRPPGDDAVEALAEATSEEAAKIVVDADHEARRRANEVVTADVVADAARRRRRQRRMSRHWGP